MIGGFLDWWNVAGVSVTTWDIPMKFLVTGDAGDGIKAGPFLLVVVLVALPLLTRRTLPGGALLAIGIVPFLIAAAALILGVREEPSIDPRLGLLLTLAGGVLVMLDGVGIGRGTAASHRIEGQRQQLAGIDPGAPPVGAQDLGPVALLFEQLHLEPRVEPPVLAAAVLRARVRDEPGAGDDVGCREGACRGCRLGRGRRFRHGFRRRSGSGSDAGGGAAAVSGTASRSASASSPVGVGRGRYDRRHRRVPGRRTPTPPRGRHRPG